MSVLLGGRQEFSLVINLSFCNGILKILFMVDARSSETGSDNWVSGLCQCYLGEGKNLAL